MWTFIRFNVVGASNTAVDLLMFFVLVHLAVPSGWAQAIGYGCGILNSFFWNRGWTFGKAQVGFGSRTFWLFVGVNVAVLAISTVWVMGVTGHGYSNVIAKFSSFGLTLPLSYFGSRWAIHRHRA
jgi:putative flippase GtrA